MVEAERGESGCEEETEMVVGATEVEFLETVESLVHLEPEVSQLIGFQFINPNGQRSKKRVGQASHSHMLS